MTVGPTGGQIELENFKQLFKSPVPINFILGPYQVIWIRVYTPDLQPCFRWFYRGQLSLSGSFVDNEDNIGSSPLIFILSLCNGGLD